MNENIIIDGYNLIRQSPTLYEIEKYDLEAGRTKLIQMLSDYKRAKRHKIAVVFDGWENGRFTQQSYMEKGIRVIFSKQGVKADEVIKKMARDTGKEYIIITSDVDIKIVAQKSGNSVISSQEFLDKLEMTIYLNMKGSNEEDEGEDRGSKVSTKKKGNPRKLPKKERNRNHKLKKL